MLNELFNSMRGAFLASTKSVIWEYLSSNIALAIYAGVLGLVLIILIFALFICFRNGLILENTADSEILHIFK